DLVKPTLILAPSPQDAHPDHRATGELAIRVLGRRGELERLRYWIVHGGLEWPLPKGLHPALPLEPPPRGRGLPWERLDLDSEEEQTKLEATRAHVSQMELLSRFMLAFVRKNELYSPTPLP
ncbi:MAG: PIG-L family deacetylase, partial [Meiothermus silvanus]|nr:PIG-L family deacetylase [Allomeiothermus silvanus]